MVAIAILCGLRRAAATSGYRPFQLKGIVVVTALSAAIAEALVLGLAWEPLIPAVQFPEDYD